MSARRVGSAWLAATLVACSSGGDSTAPSALGGSAGAAGATSVPACGKPFIGDPAAPLELELTVRGVDGVARPLVDGADAPLITPPQGGKVLFLGLRARNLSPCSVTIDGTITDPSSGQSRIDGRVINLRATDDGWGASVDTDISTFANIPVCPNVWLATDVEGASFRLSLTLKDQQQRAVTRSVVATPTCAEPDPALLAECACTCKRGYVFGQVCP